MVYDEDESFQDEFLAAEVKRWPKTGNEVLIPYITKPSSNPDSIKVELSLAKYLRISEENFKRFMKKIPQELFRKSGHIDSRGGDISLDAENLIKQYLGEDQSAFENNPFLKFYSEVDFA